MSKTCILLSTYNGERYLKDQLESLLIQDADIIIRDDGSKDGTYEILKDYKEKYPKRIRMLGNSGNLGVASSFITLLRYAVSTTYDFYFFSDQDDVWFPEKCSRAVKNIKTVDGPALYFSRKKIVDQDLQPMDVIDRINHRGNFWDAFMRSNVSGCTMCMNKALAELVIKNDFEGKCYIHDAFIYRLAICIGAVIVYDEWESILYRQHGSNVVGSVDNKRLSERFSKESVKNRNHYVQNLFTDINKQYIIPKSNIEIIQMVCEYNQSIRVKIALLQKIMKSEMMHQIKIKFTYKIIMNIL